MARRWLVDGMNVIGTRPDGWWKDRRGAMRALADSLDAFARRAGDEVTAVFDQDPRLGTEVGSVRVVVASRKGPNAADHEIVDLLAADEDPGGVWVVTSDRWLEEQVESLGARVVHSKKFRDQLDSAGEAG
jgi:predicted RNA-binding protein with PIN domain